MRPESDGTHEVVDLAIAFPVDDPTRLALRTAGSSSRKPPSFIPVLDGLNVAEVSRESVELRSGCAHNDASSLAWKHRPMT